MGQFITAVLVVSLVLWLCLVSVHVAATVALIIFCGIITVFVSTISSFKGHQKFLRDLASCRCPQCHQTFGSDAASRAEHEAEEKDEFERDQEEFEEWPIQCPNCKYVSYFVPDTQQIFSQAWRDRTESQP